MLKGISKIISPELIKILMEMGHGDEIVVSDGNFPAAGCAQRLARLDGHNIPDILEAVLKLFPLDTYVKRPVSLMAVVEGDNTRPDIWERYKEIVKKHHQNFCDFEYIERYSFYERSKMAYAVVATGESALYANIILKKGVITG